MTTRLRHAAFLLLACLGAAVAPLGAEPVSVARVEVKRLAESDLVRPAEVLGAPRTPGPVTEARSDASVAAGLYFLVSLDASARRLPAGCRAEVAIVVADSVEPRVTLIPLPEGDARSWTPDLTLALTGAADPGVAPVAWRVRLLDPAGAVLAERASALW